MELNFFKYHGAGNDFILVDNRLNRFEPVTALVASLCDRHFGIGADGLILVSKTEGFDFAMTYYNSDGRESTMCGNGGRCVVAFADFLSLASGEMRFLAVDGPHKGMIKSAAGKEQIVRISMGDVDQPGIWGKDMVIDTGSPHLLRFMEDVEGIDIIKEARPIRYHSDFDPDGINVNFIEDRGDCLFVRTYERGVEDETLSCGTGVTAAALAYAHRNHLKQGKVGILTRGGSLSVEFLRNETGTFREIWLEGPVVKVFNGAINTNNF